MKIISLLVTTLVISLSAYSQKSKTDFVSINVVPTISNSTCSLSWSGDDNLDATWEVQASKNGKFFKTIGFVWGTSADMKGICQFKQQITKASKRYKSFRVIRSAASTASITR